MSIDATIGRSSDPPTSALDRVQSIIALAHAGPVMPGGGAYPIEPPGVFANHVIIPAQVNAQIAANTFAADTLTLRLQADRLNAETAKLNAETANAEAWLANQAVRERLKLAKADTVI